ncbi:hypothetical protein MPTK1_8g00960 [Marchantia polymorpha subsp. ruderalis]|uniref:Uncharacterized protein n=1 Tax=Marchantia polymorpha TaxID=3197 RepID=A0A2R6WRD7_MARPO|nr:hypothetical protein MARPO_0064s0102 [Marchantia polymorpha]BBN18246.1 hypothetical protein Mp_8g00960 [Marchantia polymorpha subsp. ruderalis]|eukprot:PTQ36427.1 hypothetical protein MARPO_0064s0102 [Marchantia polymorpha]
MNTKPVLTSHSSRIVILKQKLPGSLRLVKAACRRDGRNPADPARNILVDGGRRKRSTPRTFRRGAGDRRHGLSCARHLGPNRSTWAGHAGSGASGNRCAMRVGRSSPQFVRCDWGANRSRANQHDANLKPRPSDINPNNQLLRAQYSLLLSCDEYRIDAHPCYFSCMRGKC